MKLSPKQKNTIRTIVTVIGIIFLTALFLAASVCLFAALWYNKVYGDTGFDSIIYTLTSDMGGVDSGIIKDFIWDALIPAIATTVIVSVLLFVPFTKKPFAIKKLHLYPLSKFTSAIISLILSFSMILYAATSVSLVSYVVSISQDTQVYMENYADPADTKITFPEEKQNLIIIYLESMETSFMTPDRDGGHSENLISDLHLLALNNTNFSQNEAVGGANVLTGGSWTIGALVSQTAGIPLKTPSGNQNDYGKEDFLPGVVTLSDILHENGYYQTLMVGSDSMFGGRKNLYQKHGTDYVYDLYTARVHDIIPEGYHDGWWGFEDHYLFEYAKQELTKISQKDQPFAFSMLTVDTHAWGGHVCKLCGSEYSEKYDNVWNCSNNQVAEFVEWIQSQDFAENTTIILSGDHLTMDSEYAKRVLEAGYDRRVYNCFINPVSSTDNTKNRDFCTIDMFPTFLGAIGCDIEGDRLGLGTNLFSETPTLCEEMGVAKFDTELSKSSDEYKKFYIPRDQWPTEETVVKEEHSIEWVIPVVIGAFAGMIVIVLVVCFFVKRKPSSKAINDVSSDAENITEEKVSEDIIESQVSKEISENENKEE
jgi:phosphoglycerol transferase